MFPKACVFSSAGTVQVLQLFELVVLRLNMTLLFKSVIDSLVETGLC